MVIRINELRDNHPTVSFPRGYVVVHDSRLRAASAKRVIRILIPELRNSLRIGARNADTCVRRIPYEVRTRERKMEEYAAGRSRRGTAASFLSTSKRRRGPRGIARPVAVRGGGEGEEGEHRATLGNYI